MCIAMSFSKSWKSSVSATKSLSQFSSMSTPILPPAWMYVPTAPSLVERAAFFCAEAMPRLRSTTNASSMGPLVSCKAFRQSPIGAPDFSRSSFTNLASIFSLTVVISLFLISLTPCGVHLFRPRPCDLGWHAQMDKALSRASPTAGGGIRKAWLSFWAATLSLICALTCDVKFSLRLLQPRPVQQPQQEPCESRRPAPLPDRPLQPAQLQPQPIHPRQRSEALP